MGKKKNSDFSKIKIKIGKNKPSNNVTKFAIKTAKVILRGDASDKIVTKNEDESYLSTEKSDLSNNLKHIDQELSEYISKKKVIMQSQRLDLTQSVWQTYYNHDWVTPWDSLVCEYNEKMGPKELWFFVILDNAASCQEKSVNEHMVRTINLYLQFLGHTEQGFQASRPILEIAKKFLAKVERGKKLLGIEILSILAQHCPMSLWYHARRKASIYVLQTLGEIFNGTKKHYEQILDEDKFIMLAHSIIYSALDGRKSGSIIIGEDWSQIDDIENPPFTDLIYEDNEERVNFVIRKVTDSKDKWDQSTLMKQDSFNLEEYLSTLTENILEIGLKMLPITLGCQQSLEKIVKVVEILSRCCLRAQSSPKWTVFIETLLKSYPYTYKEEEEEELTMEVDGDDKDELSLNKLSKKEKRLRRQRVELESKMRELCQQSKKVKNIKAVLKLNDELNYYTVALVHQTLVSGKVNEGPYISEWLHLVKDLIKSLDKSKNDVLYKWLMLGKQMFQLTFDKSSECSLLLCEVLAELCLDVFINAHNLSKVKRLSIAVYIDYCKGILRLSSKKSCSKVVIPSIDASVIKLLIELILEDQQRSGNIGHDSRHPMYVSSQIHVDITLPKAIYLLLLINYPSVGEIINNMEVETTSILKGVLNALRREIKSAEYPVPQRKWNLFRQEYLKYIPSKYLWDYFTFDKVSRKDSTVERMRPLCSSVATFILK